MAKLVLALLIALSFVTSPVAAVASTTVARSMGNVMDGMAMADHSTMDCCKPACAASCPPAVFPADYAGT